MGRPKKDIDAKEVEKLAAIGCTVSEIAAILDCSKRTLEMRFCAVIERGRERMKESLRRMQYKAAQKGNVVMMIWLGKQYLDQRDKQEHSGPDGGPIKHEVSGFGQAAGKIFGKGTGTT